MSYGLTVAITGAGLTAPARLALALHPERLAPVAGEAALVLVRNRLRILSNSRPNALGGSSTRFYARALAATTVSVSGDTATVTIAGPLGIRQRYYGGVIRPRPGKKYLTIPVAPEAHGRSAGSFSDLVVVFGKGGRPVALAHAGQGKRRFGAILYALKTSVTQRPDPTILPVAGELARAVNTAIEARVARNFS